MDENRVEGTAAAIKGGVKEGIGAFTGDVKTEWEGKREDLVYSLVIAKRA